MSEFKFPLKISIKKRLADATRGTDDPDVIIGIIMDNWGELQSAFKDFGSSDLDTVKEHFNALIAECEDLGDSLFGDLDDFKLSVSNLEFEQKKLFTDELIRVEIYDPDN